MRNDTQRPGRGDNTDAGRGKPEIGPAAEAPPRTFGEALERIRRDSASEAQKGWWFENLFMLLARQEKGLQIKEICGYADWPERKEVLGDDDHAVSGIDLVATASNGELIAIQNKCYADDARIDRAQIATFLNDSAKIDPATGKPIFARRWLVATCGWGPRAHKAIENQAIHTTRFDFLEYADTEIRRDEKPEAERIPYPEQVDAIRHTVEMLKDPGGRARLIMACGTGKTFTSLRIAEGLVPDGGTILFAVPSIALADGARKEWLSETRRPLDAAVVCSDSTAGGKGGRGREDIGAGELICPVLFAPERIAEMLSRPGGAKVLFCTYHSLDKVREAQEKHGAPGFDLAIADEAHRTTGVSRTQGTGAQKSLEARESRTELKAKEAEDQGQPEAAARIRARAAARAPIDFQLIHDQDRLLAARRLYMTATPRVYSDASKNTLRGRGYVVRDMDDIDIYGQRAYRLSFRAALEAKPPKLSPYRVVVMYLEGEAVGAELRKTLVARGRDLGININDEDIARAVGVMKALNGQARAGEDGIPAPPMHRCLAFANNRKRSRWYENVFNNSDLRGRLTRGIRADGEGRALEVRAKHLDATNNAEQRRIQLDLLRAAAKDGECRVITNVRLFSEGVDVPALDAVAFLDPRASQIDIVQAVGRVMRRAPGKETGYIIVPEFLPPADNEDILGRLEKTENKTLGMVLKALQSHDPELAKNPAQFVEFHVPPKRKPGKEPELDPDAVIRELDLEQVDDERIIARICERCLPSASQLAGDDIEYAVKSAGEAFRKAELEPELAAALGLSTSEEGGAEGACTIAALMLMNACLLQKRLQDVPQMEGVAPLADCARAEYPGRWMRKCWNEILKRDYRPVFAPAAAAAAALEDAAANADAKTAGAIRGALRSLAERADDVADSLSEMGMDHAGPLYHRILGTAQSDGAYYTNNVSAVLLARLALGPETCDWSDPAAVAALRIMDPACGTGTLLMAALRTIKERVATAGDPGAAASDKLHQTLVENSLCGLDINPHAVQLAACNLTLGAPTVDYQRMNLATMPHGPVAGGVVRAGSLEILAAADDADLASLTGRGREFKSLDAEQVDDAGEIKFPLQDLHVVIMNPPFSADDKRDQKFDDDATGLLKSRYADIRSQLVKQDPVAGGAAAPKVIRSFFASMADLLLGRGEGTLATVMPVAACIGASGLRELRFLAERFHIERIFVSHDQRHKKHSFSGATGIHDCLLVARRFPQYGRPPTEFVALRKMPDNVDEAVAIANSILTENAWGGGRCVAGLLSVCRLATGHPLCGTTHPSPRSYIAWKCAPA